MHKSHEKTHPSTSPDLNPAEILRSILKLIEPQNPSQQRAAERNHSVKNGRTSFHVVKHWYHPCLGRFVIKNKGRHAKF